MPATEADVLAREIRAVVADVGDSVTAECATREIKVTPGNIEVLTDDAGASYQA